MILDPHDSIAKLHEMLLHALLLLLMIGQVTHLLGFHPLRRVFVSVGVNSSKCGTVQSHSAVGCSSDGDSGGGGTMIVPVVPSGRICL